MRTVLNWSEGLISLRSMPAPLDFAGIQTPRWGQLLPDADTFLNRWGDEAATLGWTALDLFGCDRVKPYARVDLAGLVLLLNGRRVVELSATGAMIEVHGGRYTWFTRRRPTPEQTVVWDWR